MAALSSLRQAIDIKPEYPDAHSELGYSYRLLNRNQEAIQEYQTALSQKPDHGLAYLGLADTYYYNTKQYKEAAAAYRQGLRLRPGSATSNFNFGWCLNDLEQYAEAVTVLREAVRIKSEYAEAHNELGYALQHLNRYPEAVQEFSTAITQRKDYALAHYNLGATYVAMGNRNGALQEYRILQRIDPPSATKLAGVMK
jgi:tetratricopeptide (TPR) repeat protein